MPSVRNLLLTSEIIKNQIPPILIFGQRPLCSFKKFQFIPSKFPE